MIRFFITGIPDELIYSARMDGAGEFEILRQVLVPLIRSGLVVRGTFIFANQYTSWPLAAVRDPQKQVIAVGISGLRAIFTVDWGPISAASLFRAAAGARSCAWSRTSNPATKGKFLSMAQCKLRAPSERNAAMVFRS